MSQSDSLLLFPFCRSAHPMIETSSRRAFLKTAALLPLAAGASAPLANSAFAKAEPPKRVGGTNLKI